MSVRMTVALKHTAWTPPKSKRLAELSPLCGFSSLDVAAEKSTVYADVLVSIDLLLAT